MAGTAAAVGRVRAEEKGANGFLEGHPNAASNCRLATAGWLGHVHVISVWARDRGEHANRCRDFAAGRGSWQVFGTGEATRDCCQLWLRPLGKRPEERRAPGGDRGARGGGPLEASVAAESRVSDMNFWTHAAGMEVLRTVPAGAGAATSKKGAWAACCWRRASQAVGDGRMGRGQGREVLFLAYRGHVLFLQ